MFVCWSAKGGSGTTVVAAALALLRAESRSTVLVDTGGDLPAALGIAEPAGPGIADWMASPAADADALHRLESRSASSCACCHAGLVRSTLTVGPHWSTPSSPTATTW